MAEYSYTYTPNIRGGYVYAKGLYSADTIKTYTVFQTHLTTSGNLTDGSHSTKVGYNAPDHNSDVYLNFAISAEEERITAILTDVPANATSITLKLYADARYSKNKTWSSVNASVRSYKNSKDPLEGSKTITVSNYVRSSTINTTRADKVLLTYTGATKTAVYNALYSGAGRYPIILVRLRGTGSFEQDASSIFRADCYEVWWEVSYTVPDVLVRLKVNGAWQSGTLMVKANGEWHDANTAYMKINGTWNSVDAGNPISITEYLTSDGTTYGSFVEIPLGESRTYILQEGTPLTGTNIDVFYRYATNSTNCTESFTAGTARLASIYRMNYGYVNIRYDGDKTFTFYNTSLDPEVVTLYPVKISYTA